MISRDQGTVDINLLFRGQWRLVSYDDRPRAYLPARNEAIEHIRIVAHELLDRGPVRSTENQKRFVHRISQGTTKHELASAICFLRELEMVCPVR